MTSRYVEGRDFTTERQLRAIVRPDLHAHRYVDKAGKQVWLAVGWGGCHTDGFVYDVSRVARSADGTRS